MGTNPTFDAVILAGVLWLALRALREQRVPVATIWMLPGLMLLLGASQLRIFATHPLSNASALVAGLLSGLAVGALTYRRADRRAGVVVTRGTPLSALVWPGSVALALLAQYALRGRIGADTGELLNTALLAFAVGNVASQRAYLHWRFQRAVHGVGDEELPDAS